MGARVIAIDGPSGAGKSTVAKRLAERLQTSYLDTGAMYRSLALKAKLDGVDVDDPEAVRLLVEATTVELRPSPGGAVGVLLDGEPVGEEIRAQEIGRMASLLAAQPPVREAMVGLQRAYGRSHGAVVEGRDIGTVVFPDTPFKFFLDARVEARAERRWHDLLAGGEEPSLSEVVVEIEGRDRRDRERTDSPLRCDASYYRIDTSDRTVEQVLDAICARVASIEEAVGAAPGAQP
jgi:cytidylate kinase